MRRKTVHVGFAAVACVCAVLAAYEAVSLVRASRISDALAAASSARTVAVSAGAAPRIDALPRPVALAQAVALAASGQYGEAGRRYEALIAGGPLDEIGRAALFDLGNLYLRQGAGNEAALVRSVPMIEQAKARYRALLRVAPDDWDARYNLERALRLVPELAGDADEANGTTKRNIKLRGAKSEDLP
ncbi:hypothetical protein WKR88_11075 [Trinickia caryophylli]|uniref:MxaK protein n=1 Tax=Trinickia caryophylli TaxID=28094 RepID=A0A1X7E2K4_TRICW|nr:hypothetical protein [Trinickia caryophylli]PMS14047.1 hypothetical protein C0Z17_00435 [Trinickia caryophylli]TRX17743.1 hypothetical protein FNF07_05580 [Trinickia caryophylli]WQE11495.1 hypothetical protein U0034_17345 [Trinickia caryophylli]SMF25696.1 mxaK protein [Trinickia caryophylli]GLU32659.1 hypothetical protein Busp01_25010 [Trinickia caryophylli]